MSGAFKLLVFSAIAQEDEEHHFMTPWVKRTVHRRMGEALHPEREPPEVLLQQRVLLGPIFYSAQYLQAPVPVEGNLVNPGWFKRFGMIDLVRVERVFQSWDTASKPNQLNDYSACVTCAVSGDRIFILDVYRERLELPALTRKVVELANHYKAEVVLVEDKGSGIGLLQELKSARFYKGTPIVPIADKVSRFNGVTPMIEQGRVYLPESAPWEEAYLRELCAFPKGRFDDQVDATSQLLGWIREHSSPGAIFEYYRQEAEAKRAFEEDQDVQLQAPVGVSHATMIDGQKVSVGPDGTLWVRGKDAGPLIRSGFTRLN